MTISKHLDYSKQTFLLLMNPVEFVYDRHIRYARCFCNYLIGYVLCSFDRNVMERWSRFWCRWYLNFVLFITFLFNIWLLFLVVRTTSLVLILNLTNILFIRCRTDSVSLCRNIDQLMNMNVILVCIQSI